jgi:hypothetical protein
MIDIDFFYVFYGAGIAVAWLATRSVIKMNRELHERNAVARQRERARGGCLVDPPSP